MKKLAAILLLFTALLALSACSVQKNVTITVGEPTEKDKASPAQMTTELTIPKFAAELADIDLLSAAESLGVSDITQNADGSYTYRMTPEQKAQLQAAMKSSLESYLESLRSDWPFAEKIEMSENYDHVTIFSSKAQFSPERDRKIAAAIYAPAVLCRIFLEADTPDDFKLGFSVLGKETLEALDSFTYPEEKPAASPSADGSDTDTSDSSTDSQNSSSAADDSTGSEENSSTDNRGNDIPGDAPDDDRRQAE